MDIVKGAFEKEARYLSFYSSDSDVIRITGYLVKRSEIEKLRAGNNVLQDTTKLGISPDLTSGRYPIQPEHALRSVLP